MPQIPDVVILSGGLGLRLRGVIGDVPKSMAPIGSRPFMELQFRQLRRQGFSRLILSVGYKREVIQQHFGSNALGLTIRYSAEESPLGTGGALREAAAHLTTDDALIMNGDSYTDVDLNRLIRAHAAHDADLTVVVVPETRSDAGSVALDPNGEVRAFAEKRVIPESRYLSAGIYVLKKELANTIPRTVKISLEEELFPHWLNTGKHIEGFVFEGQCLDIGTPERYERAQHLLEKVELETIFESEGRS